MLRENFEKLLNSFIEKEYEYTDVEENENGCPLIEKIRLEDETFLFFLTNYHEVELVGGDRDEGVLSTLRIERNLSNGIVVKFESDETTIIPKDEEEIHYVFIENDLITFDALSGTVNEFEWCKNPIKIGPGIIADVFDRYSAEFSYTFSLIFDLYKYSKDEDLLNYFENNGLVLKTENAQIQFIEPQPSIALNHLFDNSYYNKYDHSEEIDKWGNMTKILKLEEKLTFMSTVNKEQEDEYLDLCFKRKFFDGMEVEYYEDSTYISIEDECIWDIKIENGLLFFVAKPDAIEKIKTIESFKNLAILALEKPEFSHYSCCVEYDHIDSLPLYLYKYIKDKRYSKYFENNILIVKNNSCPVEFVDFEIEVI